MSDGRTARTIKCEDGETNTLSYGNAEPIGGTFTICVGYGTSDPVPYNADNDQVQAAFDQAAQRNREGRGK
jgi:hypothetical protein